MKYQTIFLTVELIHVVAHTTQLIWCSVDAHCQTQYMCLTIVFHGTVPYVDNELAAVVALMKQVVARQQHVPRCSLRLRLLGEIFTIFSNILSMSSRKQV